MILRRVQLEQYGRFRAGALDLGPGLHLLVGRNEAGKTTLLQALRDLLYGIPQRTGYGWRFGRPSMRIQAEIEGRDGTRLELVRTSRRQSLDPDAALQLARWTGGTPRELFESVFGITLDDLRAGADGLETIGLPRLLAGGALGGAGDRFAAAQTWLRERIDALYKPRGQVPLLNARQREFAALESELQLVQLRPHDLAELETRAADSNARCETLEAGLRAVRSRLRHCERLAGKWRDHRALTQVRRDLAALPEAAGLSVSEAGELLRLHPRVTRWDAQEQALLDEIDQVRNRLDGEEELPDLDPGAVEALDEWDDFVRTWESAAAALADEEAAVDCDRAALAPVDLPARADTSTTLAERVEERAGLAAAARAAADKAAAARAEFDERQSALEAFRSVEHPPDPDELAAARRARDELWTALRGDPPEADPAAFEAAMRRADDLADHLWQAAGNASRLLALRTEAEAARRRAAAADQTRAAAHQALGEWDRDWRDGGFGDQSPEEALAWRRTLDEIEARQRRLAARRRQLESDQTRVETIRRRLRDALAGPDPSDDSAAPGWTTLVRRFRQRHQARLRQVERRRTETARLRDRQDALTAGRNRVASQLKLLNETAARLGCAELPALFELAEATKQRHAWLTRLQELEHSLGDLIDHPDFDSRSLAEVEAEARDLYDRARTLEEERRTAREELGGVRNELGKLGTEQTALLRAEVAERRAGLDKLADRYLLLRSAETILQRAVEQFGRRHQEDLLEQTAALLRQLTAGRYTGLEPEQGGLRVIGAEGAKTPRQLSTGTREQLFFAFRLAYIVQHAEAREPLPVILDDALVNFDDERADRAIQALRDLHPEVQVLLLSCHQRMADLARQAGVSIVQMDQRLETMAEGSDI